MGKLDGKVAVVTGASRGIGKSIAEVFASEGAKVVCAARTLKEGDHPLEGSLEHTVEGIRAAGGEATPVVANLSEYDDCVRLIEEARREYGPIDVLVNNAALTYFYPIKDFPINRWRRSLEVNFNAIFYLSQMALHDMVPRKSGAIVSISSEGAIGPGRGPYKEGYFAPGGTLYGAEKAAVERFTQGLAEEVYHDNIAVTCVSPSLMVKTPGVMYHAVPGQDTRPSEPPEYMARAALLLATEPVDKVTGRVTYSQQILVEFGWLAEGAGRGIDEESSGFSKI